MKNLNTTLSVFFFVFLTLLIIFPLLPPGFIVTLDLPPIERPRVEAISNHYFFVSSFFYLLAQIIPNYLTEKFILFLILFLSYWGMHRLVPVENKIGKIFAGTFYMVNPFVYERLVTGQWLLVLGYAVFPWIVSLIIRYPQNHKWKNILLLSVLLTLLANISLHFFVITNLFFMLYLISLLFKDFHYYKGVLFSLGKLLGLVAILNINWLAGFFLSIFSPVGSFSSFNREDLITFQSVADPTFGLIPNLLGGFGFWPEVYDYFISSKNFLPFWPLLTIVLLGLSLYGFYLLLRKKDHVVLSITFGVFFLIALDLAAGVALPNFSQIIAFLYDKIFILRGFREPQKLVAIIMFSYAYFGSFGLDSLLARVKENSKSLVLTSWFLVLPLVYTLPIFFGFWGQLKPVFYPTAWYEINNILNKDRDNFLVLFFPWHQYMQFKFANNRVVANPAPYFFDKPILSSLNYETAYLYTHDIRPESLHVEGLLSIEKEGVNLLGENVYERESWGKALSPIDVKYIILVKEDDWRRYRFLDEQNDIKKIFESSEIDLYQNLKWGMVGEEIELLDSFGVFLVS